MTDTETSSTQRGIGDILADGHGLPRDIALISRAVRERWAVPDDMAREVIQRMGEIANKRIVTVPTNGGGMASVEYPADCNAVRAAAVLVSMRGQNQADDHLADKNSRLDAGQATERVAIAPTITLRGVSGG